MLKSLKAGLFLGLALSLQPVWAEEATPAEAVPAVNGPEKIVQNVCAACHGADGNSVITTNPKLAGQHPEYLVKQLTNFKEGTRANAVMSGMAAALSAEDMEGLAKYFSSQSIKLAKAKSNGKGSLGEKIYRGGIAATQVPACAACHGATGAGLPKQFPRLAGQHSDYTVQQLRTFRTGERANAPMMMTIAAKMSDAEMQAVADYIQGLR
ncbi:c-type cytochrome [Methylophilus aquaticus]|uniref:C-type cytochrome n=1 Tax=Methylophilus aquaticus TaxID=1971610 RepID=A0ABT9JW50_9PROT|nr:c-type cytochrome [Methylophilus aquaticus]MDP8568813.1 c-type cytochrome [Methylophilus aquaticus]